MSNRKTKYASGEIILNSKSKKLLKLLKQKILNKKINFPREKILIEGHIHQRCKTIYDEISNSEINLILKELADELAVSLNLSNPVMPDLADLHDFFSVNLHNDSSIYSESSQSEADKMFFSTEKKCIKFYFKMPLSFLDLLVKRNENDELYFLKSNNNQIAYFDVRSKHQTYFPLFNSGSKDFFLNKLSLLINSYLVKLHRKIKGVSFKYFGNFCLIYEDCETWRNYIEIEKDRSLKQIFY